MKARVYGWACDPTNEFRTFFFGDIKDVYQNDEWHGFKFKHNSNEYTVHKNQVEIIKEITITEEEFDNSFNLVLSKHKECGFTYDMRNLLNEFKEELFKGVK